MRTVSRHDYEGGSGKVFSISYSRRILNIFLYGGRNRGSKYAKPYANFSLHMVNRFLELNAWINNENSWGVYYVILNKWTLGSGFSCYNHAGRAHCDRRGNWIPTFQLRDTSY